MEDLIIETKNLCKNYGDFTAVEDLNLTIRRGDVYGFLGPNGSGKSTTIRMLLTLIRPTSGEIFLLGKSLLKNRIELLGKMGSIVEKPDFYKYLSAKENLRIFGAMNGTQPTTSRIMELIELVGLKGRENDKVKGFSHGMKQRLGIAQTLLNDPELIILDEPTTGLDPQGIIDIRNLITYLQKEKGKTILLSSHILSEIELISNRMVIINKGKAIVEGEVSQLLNEKELIVSISVSDPQKCLLLLSGTQWQQRFLGQEQHSLKFQLSSNEVPQVNKFFVEEGIEVSGLESRKKLEDYFLKLVSN